MRKTKNPKKTACELRYSTFFHLIILECLRGPVLAEKLKRRTLDHTLCPAFSTSQMTPSPFVRGHEIVVLFDPPVWATPAKGEDRLIQGDNTWVSSKTKNGWIRCRNPRTDQLVNVRMGSWIGPANWVSKSAVRGAMAKKIVYQKTSKEISEFVRSLSSELCNSDYLISQLHKAISVLRKSNDAYKHAYDCEQKHMAAYKAYVREHMDNADDISWGGGN